MKSKITKKGKVAKSKPDLASLIQREIRTLDNDDKEKAAGENCVKYVCHLVGTAFVLPLSASSTAVQHSVHCKTPISSV